MNMKIFYLLLAAYFLPLQSFALANDSVRLVLEELDAIIDNKLVYHTEKEKHIEVLKQKLKNDVSDEEKLDVYGQLFNDYLHYQADSSLYYIDERIRLLSSMEREDLEAETLISRAEVLGLIGMYTEALEELKQIDSKTLDLKSLKNFWI